MSWLSKLGEHDPSNPRLEKENINDNDDKLSILMVMMRSHCNEDTNNALHAHNYDG